MFRLGSLNTLTEQKLDSAALQQGDGFGRAFLTKGEFRIKLFQGASLEFEHRLEASDDAGAPRTVLINVSDFLKPDSHGRDTIWKVRTGGVVTWWLSAESKGVYLTGEEKVEAGFTPIFDSRKLSRNELYRHVFLIPGTYKIKNAEGAAEGTIEVTSAREARSPEEFKHLAAKNERILCTKAGIDKIQVKIMAASAVVWFVSEDQKYRITQA